MNARPLPCPPATRRFALALLLLLAGAGPAGAEIFTVDTTADPVGGGAGTLRQAVLDANASADTENTIVFELPDDSTITLMTPLDDITQTLMIDGTTATNLTIEGDGVDQIFRVAAGTTSVQDTSLEMGPLEVAARPGRFIVAPTSAQRPRERFVQRWSQREHSESRSVPSCITSSETICVAPQTGQPTGASACRVGGVRLPGASGDFAHPLGSSIGSGAEANIFSTRSRS